MSICEFYARIYAGVLLSTVQSAANSLHRQIMLDSALPELYAAVIVFAVKARTYFEARGTYAVCEVHIDKCEVHIDKYNISLNNTKPELGIKKFASTFKSFDIEFQPFIGEINLKEGVIRECADAATMKRVRGMLLHMVLDTIG